MAPVAVVFAACATGQLPRGFDPKWVKITVVDAAKRPVVGAEVTGPGTSSRTDARGQAQLPFEKHDTFDEFGVAAAGFVSLIRDADWRYGCDQVIELQPDEPIRVRVLEAGTDRPLGGVRVGGHWSKVFATTADDGLVEVRGMAPLGGSMPYLRLFRWRDDYFQWGHEKWRSRVPRKEPVVLDGDTYIVRLRPLPLKEFVLRAAPGRTFSEPARIEADGDEVPNVVVEAGGKQLRCRLPPYMWPPVRVPGHEEFDCWPKDDAEEPIVVDLRAAVRCSGRVLGPDGPIAGARVSMSWGEHPTRWRVVRTGEDGTWSASDCPRNEDISMGVSAACHLTVGLPVPALAERAPATTEDVALGDVRLEREQLAVARLDPSWCGQSVQLWTTVTDGLAITGVHWSSMDAIVVIRGLGRGVHRLKWRIGKDEHHRDFELDGSRTIVDVGALPGVAPPPR